MSQVQNSTLHNYVQPALILGSAFLSGRFIEHFPGASQGGLLLTAALGTGTALVSQKGASANETPFYSFMRVTASLALGTILAPYAAKALKGRADIAMPAALRFAAVETVLAAVLAVVSSRLAPQGPDLQAEHTKYANDAGAWEALTEEARTTLVKQFYIADLPAIDLSDAPIKQETLAQYRDFPRMSAHQLSWHIEEAYYIVDYVPQDLFGLNLALKSKGLELAFDGEVDQAMIDYAQGKPDCINLLHEYYMENPVDFVIDSEDSFTIGDLFAGKLPIPTLKEHLQTLDAQEFRSFNQDQLQCIYDAIEEGSSLQQKDLTLAQQIAFNTEAHSEGVNTLQIWPITQEVVDFILADDDTLEWFHTEYKEKRAQFEQIESTLRATLNAQFLIKGKEVIVT
ncbi:MAG: hypothetical protein AB7N99_06170 [Simkaniaceae bacterium]